ncbi:hypothetical protein [Pengzhenrongella frigida]|uniref:Uncharacterized protein n=1 Tax=Pengzhenrongella frigida TaxID=1259133 RepID=A0A4Q5N725_9MICO|nr:hypothetical protein [Cellulomonas sp. HLT2-17]RYV52201.1 hypothetical protein EUA98_04315 [Cellulomonas sp. HLT2-17]
MPATRFAISYSPVSEIVLKLVGMGPARSGVWVDAESVRVAMGWGFQAEFPRRSVRSIGPGTISWWDGRGSHGWGGNRIVNGSADGLVRLELAPESRATIMGFGVRLRTLRLSLADPTALTTLLAPPTH